MTMKPLNLLKTGLGLDEQKTFPVYHDMNHLAGTWSREDENEFFQHIQTLETVDAELWK